MPVMHLSSEEAQLLKDILDKVITQMEATLRPLTEDRPDMFHVGGLITKRQPQVLNNDYVGTKALASRLARYKLHKDLGLY